MAHHSRSHPHRWRIHIPFFRIFYSTTYTSLYIILLVILAITPASLIYSSIASSAYQYVFMVGAAYVTVTIITLFIYSSRLYSNRSVIAGVGKAYIPIRADEVGKKVRKEIDEGFRYAASVREEITPRDISADPLRSENQIPPWGILENPGWSAPRAGATNSHIRFDTVVLELCNLFEARVVSLVRPDVEQEEYRRPPLLGFREYLSHLDRKQLVQFPECTDRFVDLYERARFSSRPLNQAEFDDLMATFADVLSGLNVGMS